MGGPITTATLLKSQDYINKVIASTVSYSSECRKLSFSALYYTHTQNEIVYNAAK
jgi:hypothetical protein